MDVQLDEILFNNLTVSTVVKTDPYEGVVTLITSTKKEIRAFFWGQTFELHKMYKIKFSCLEYPLKWETIFSENKNHRLTLESEKDPCSYLGFGKIVGINPVIVDFGDIVMSMGEWTNDERTILEFVYFKIDRLDILEVRNCT